MARKTFKIAPKGTGFQYTTNQGDSCWFATKAEAEHEGSEFVRVRTEAEKAANAATRAYSDRVGA